MMLLLSSSFTDPTFAPSCRVSQSPSDSQFLSRILAPPFAWAKKLSRRAAYHTTCRFRRTRSTCSRAHSHKGAFRVQKTPVRAVCQISHQVHVILDLFSAPRNAFGRCDYLIQQILTWLSRTRLLYPSSIPSIARRPQATRWSRRLPRIHRCSLDIRASL